MPGEIGPDIDPGRGAQVGTAKLDRQFVIRARPAVIVKGALSKDKMIVVEVKAGGIVKQDLPHLAVKGLVIEVDLEVKFLQGPVHCFPKIKEAFLAGKAIRLQQNLVFAVVNYIVG